MRDAHDSRRQPSDDAETASIELLSEAAIRKSLRSAALQHPATIIPSGLAALCVVYLAIFASGFIPPLLAIIVLLGSLLGAVASFGWIYSIRHDSEYAKLVQEILTRQGKENQENQQASTEQLREDLRTGLSAINSEAGLKALNNLDYEYEELNLVLNQQDNTASISVAHIPGLAEETYRQGLNVLAKGLQLARAVRVSNREKLENEVVELQKEIESLEKHGSHERRVNIRQEKVALRKDHIERLNQQQYRLDELLFQSDLCESTLATTRIELASLQAGSTETSVNAVTETLQRTIDQAKEVQAEMQKLGY